MGGEGSMAAMRVSLKNNANLLSGRKKRGYFKRELSYAEIRMYYKESTAPLTDGGSGAQNIQEIRVKLIAERRKNLNILIVLALVSSISVGFVMLSILGKTHFGSTKHIPKYKSVPSIIVTDSYSNYMQMANSSLLNNDYFFAIGNYQRALQVIPNQRKAEFGLAKAYAKSCKYKNQFCEEADAFIAEMEEKYSDQTGFTKLRANYLKTD